MSLSINFLLAKQRRQNIWETLYFDALDILLTMRNNNDLTQQLYVLLVFRYK